jgi:hypothetical protein
MAMDDFDDALLGYLLKLSEDGEIRSQSRNSSSEPVGLIPPDALWDALRGVRAPDGSTETTDVGAPLPNRSGSGLPAASIPTHWRESLLSVAAFLRQESATAFDVHQSASQALVLGLEERQGTTILSDEATNYVTLCTLLCCWALQLHRKEDLSVRKRPKRWQSLVFETLRLFQIRSVNVLDSASLGTVWIPLWVHHVLPSTLTVQRSLLSYVDHPNPPAPNLVASLRRTDVAYLSTVVAVTARLARRCCQLRIREDFQQTIKQRLGCLLGSLWDPVEGCYDVVLLCHPWRLRFGTPAEGNAGTLESFQTLHSALRWWSTTGEGMDVDTRWDSRGVAALAAVAWDECRAFVWSPSYTWKLWFPHVTTLLDDANDDKEHEPDENDEGQREWQIRFQSLGFQLLRNALVTVPSFAFSLTIPKTYSHMNRKPDDPIGVLQLLSNRILAASSEAKFDAVEPRGHSLPTGGETFQIMRGLIDKYKPLAQTGIVRLLVRDCPHPGLRPKLLDLLRPFVAWEDPPAVRAVWQYVEESLATLESHCQPGLHGMSPRVVEVDELLESAELYVSSLNLLYLWTRVRKCLPDVPSLPSRLSSIHSVLQALHTEHSNKNEEDRYFRLQLLESALEQNIEAMSVH